MKSLSITISDMVSIVCLSVGAVGLCYSLISYWGYELSAIDRYLVVLGSIWAAATTWPSTFRLPVRPWPLVGILAVVVASILYLPVWFLTWGITSGRVILIWWQWIALSLATGGYVLSRFGPSVVRAGLFPLAFVVFAFPLPTLVERPLQTTLQRITTTISYSGMRAVGFSVERPNDGFILRLPGGDLGVEEACSGIRSLVALTALAAFVAFRRGIGPTRGIALVLATVPVVVAVNVVRVLLSGFIQEWFGGDYIRGSWHESLGLVMVLVGLGGILAVARWLGRTKGKEPAEQPQHQPSRVSQWGPRIAMSMMLLGAVGTLALGWRAAPIREDDTPVPNVSEFPVQLSDWEGEDRPIPAYVKEALQYDAVLHREYRNRIGRRAEVWVIYWSAAGRVKGYHHPDVCLPNAGLATTERGVETIHPEVGGEIPVTARTLSSDNGQLFVLYWTQEGRRVWDEQDERAASSELGLKGLISKLQDVKESVSLQPSGARLVVLVGAGDSSAFGRVEILDFTQKLADELYRLCPWAAPPEMGSKSNR